MDNQPIPETLNPPISSVPQYNSKIFAGFWIRFAAFQIDLLLLSLVLFPLGILIQNSSVNRFLLYLIYLPVSVFMIYKFGATPGKMFFGVKVVSKKESTIQIGTAILREIVGKLVNLLTLMIGFLIVAFDKDKQGLHDKIASTEVILLKPLSAIKKILVWIIGPLVLLIVPILGVLSVGLLVAVDPTTRINEAADSASKSDISQIAFALRTYNSENNKYPSNIDELARTPSSGVNNVYQSSSDRSTASVYIPLKSKGKGYWCWQSKLPEIRRVETTAECQP